MHLQLILKKWFKRLSNVITEKLQNGPTGGVQWARQWGTMSQVIENVGQDEPTQVFFDYVGICAFHFDNEYIALFLVYDLINALH